MLLLLLFCACAKFAGACSCSPAHPQQAYCDAKVVIRAKLVEKKVVVTRNDAKMVQYDVKQIKMFKGPDREVDTILTGFSSSLCGVNLETSGENEYLITGRLVSNGTLSVNLCDYVKTWESLSMTQKKSLGQRYQMGCDCKIVQCPSIPCSINNPSECLWTDWVMEEKLQGSQAQYNTCIKRHDNSCAWYRGFAPPNREFMDIEDP